MEGRLSMSPSTFLSCGPTKGSSCLHSLTPCSARFPSKARRKFRALLDDAVGIHLTTRASPDVWAYSANGMAPRIRTLVKTQLGIGTGSQMERSCDAQALHHLLPRSPEED